MYRDAETRRMLTRRALLLTGGKLLVASVLAGRMYQLQVIRSERYKMLAEDNRVGFRLLPPLRGRILDRFGEALAINREHFRVLIVAERAENVAATLDRLDQLIGLDDDERADALAEISRRQPFLPIVVREGLDWNQVARIQINAPDLPGVIVDVGQMREYPYSVKTAHVLGHVGAVGEDEAGGDPLLMLPGFRIGKIGAEKAGDIALRGRPGTSQIEVDATGRVIRELNVTPATPGSDVRLTLDLPLQMFAQNRLALYPAAAAVVLGIDGGDVLAMASTPGYEPNQFVSGLDAATWRAIDGDPLSPMTNRAISGNYPPGSTFKMVVALAGLEGGIFAPGHRVTCSGFVEMGDSRFHCWRRGGHGRIGLIQALARSCDVYFYDVAERIGVDRIAAMARKLGFGERLLSSLPGERAGLVPTRAWKRAARDEPWYGGETLITGIGQGYLLATPLQLAVMTARLASGRAVRPRLTMETPEAPGDRPADPGTPVLGVPERWLEIVRKGMHAVANRSYGTAFKYIPRRQGFELAGKTGTSQVRRTSKRERSAGIRRNLDRPWTERDHALFVAYAPAAAPRYAVAVVVEHGGGGSKVAAPIANDIMARTLERDPLARGVDRPLADGDGDRAKSWNTARARLTLAEARR